MAFFHFDAATMENPPFQKEFVWLEPHPWWKIRYSRRYLGGDPKGSWVGLFFILDILGDAHSNEVEHFPAGLAYFLGFRRISPVRPIRDPHNSLVSFILVSLVFVVFQELSQPRK